MKLTKISGTAFMGGTFSVELGDLNLIHGSNDSGKTRLGNLIKLLLLGYLPALGKLPGEIFKLSSGAIMEVNGEFDNGEVIHRTWKQSGDRIQTVKKVPVELEDTTPLVLLDANDYFGRSARGRVEMVFSVADISSVKVDFPEEIARTLRLSEGMTDAKAQAAMTMQELIDNALNGVEEERKRIAADVRRYTQTLQGLSALQLADKPATRSVEEIDADIQTEQNAGAEKRARRTTLEEAQKKNEQLELERDSLQHRIAQAGDPVPREFDIAKLRGREASICLTLGTARARVADKEEWKRKDDIRQREIDRLVSEIKEIEKLGTDVSALEKRITKIEAAIAKQKPSTCKTCKQKVYPKPVKDADKLPELTAEWRGCRERVDNATRKGELIAELVKQARPEPEVSTDNIDVLEAELKQVRDDIAEFVQTAEVVTWRKQLAEMAKPVNHGAEMAALAIEVLSHVDRVETLRTERKAAESDRQDRKRLQEAQNAQEGAILIEMRYKEAKKFLLEKKAELIKQVFDPLLQTAERFMRGIFLQPIEYRDGELGMFSGSSWVTEATFGGAKRALLHAALQCALGAQSPCRIILMDELATIDAVNTKHFLQNIVAAHKAGAFDQFVGMTARLDEDDQTGIRFLPKGFTCIEAKDNTYARS